MLRRKLFISSLVLSVLLGCSSVVSGENVPMWTKTYGRLGNDVAYLAIEAPDGGYVVAGSTTAFGDSSADCLLVKIDEFGNILWARTYDEWYGRVYSLISTSDGGYALAGSTRSVGPSHSDFWLIKIDGLGNMLWSQTYRRAGSDVAYSVIETSDGGYALVGSTFTTSFDLGFGGDNCWLVKTDEFGTMEWNHIYGGGASDIAYYVEEYSEYSWRWGTTSEGYYLAGVTSSYGADEVVFWSTRTNASGYGGVRGGASHRGTDDWVTSFVVHSDGISAMAGYTNTTGAGGYDAWLLDDGWSNEETRIYGGTGNDIPHSLIATPDGGYVMAGTTDSFGSGLNDSWLIKTSAGGIMQWQRTYGGTGNDVAYSVTETSDGGYLVVGSTDPFGDGNSDFWLVKTNEDGNTLDLLPPYICTVSPQNTTYTTNSVSLDFIISEESSWMGYSLDGQSNVTITDTTMTLAGLSNGSHNITVYVADTEGNTGTSGTIYFTIEMQSIAWTAIVTAIAIVALGVAGITLLVYFTKARKKSG